jgi:hypothetical protein
MKRGAEWRPGGGVGDGRRGRRSETEMERREAEVALERAEERRREAEMRKREAERGEAG